MTNSPNVGRVRLHTRRALLAVSTILCSGLAAPALAQSTPSNLPDQPLVDDQGFDLLSKGFQAQAESLSVGDDQTGMEFHRKWIDGTWVHNYNFEFSITPVVGGISTAQGIIGDSPFFITLNNGVYTDASGAGKTFYQSGSGYIVLLKDGTKVVFDKDIDCPTCTQGVAFVASKVIKPNGETIV